MAAYYWDGEQVGKLQALSMLEDAAGSQGYERENYIGAWKSAASPNAEESREFLNEVSGYHLEIVVEY
jgi:hypothetical protein